MGDKKSIKQKMEEEEIDVPEEMYPIIVKIDDAMLKLEEGLDEVRESIHQLMWDLAKAKTEKEP